MRERELKQRNANKTLHGSKSLPMRERELKPGRRGSRCSRRGRSPCGSVN